MNNFIEQADSEVSGANETPLSLEEYVENIIENPQLASQSSKYLLEAIESCGKRTVIESGEEIERWCFFDDVYGNGENAVLGNTRILNEFVDDLRRMAIEQGENNKIIWFGGPTATGKSELKRCLVSGLSGYSKTDEGKFYTMEWNISQSSDDSSMTYGDSTSVHDTEWYESRVNSHPLTVFPPETRQKILNQLETDSETKVSVEEDLSPFCAEAYNSLKKSYESDCVDDLFSTITDQKHLRIIRKPISVGEGIGILHSEDDGSPKERLVGSWMPSVMQDLESRGRKNPQAFSYDGVLSQGNRALTLVEDASQHIDLLQKLLNIPEEQMVKLDKKISMDIDTVLVVLSNPDLDFKLNQHSDKIGKDPLKALRRRLEKYEFRYLTRLSSEVELIHREFAGMTETWNEDQKETNISNPLAIQETEISPHTVEAAAMYSIVSRLSEEDLPDDLDLIDKACLLENGYHMDGNEKINIEKYDLDMNSDGKMGIPVTYTTGILGNLTQSKKLILPHELLEEMSEKLNEEPMFSEEEVTEFEHRVDGVTDYIWKQQESDVLEAILKDKTVSEDAIEDYVEQVYAWHDSEEEEPEEDEFNPLEMKIFEIEHLGEFEESDYKKAGNSKVFRESENKSNTHPTEEVKQFRVQRIINTVNNHVWNQRDGFEISDVPLREIPLFESILGSYDWDAVINMYENFNPDQWRDPPAGTETEKVKNTTLDNMIEMFDYSKQSALQTSIRVFDKLTKKESTNKIVKSE